MLLTTLFRNEAQHLLGFIRDDRGDMAEKAVMMAAIIVIAILLWRLLGVQIANTLQQVVGAF